MPAAQNSRDRSYRVALNIGVRPTVAAGPQLRVEAHLLDFSGELYGAELEVEIGAKLRDEQRFSFAGGIAGANCAGIWRRCGRGLM